jgi:hypothetical protein
MPKKSEETGTPDVVQEWIESIETETTRETYGYAVKKLFKAMRVTGREALEKGRLNTTEFWIAAKKAAANFPDSGRHKALNALKTFLRAYDIYPPADRLKFPKRKKSVGMTWQEALAVANAASEPYKHIIKLMLHCGWGIQQFLQFNTQENWDAVRRHLANQSAAPYYHQDMENRKSNPQPFYSLIPTKLLREILNLKIDLPIKSERGAKLDMTNYRSARSTLDAAFKEALNRTSTPNKERIKLHEVRDTFKSSGTTAGTTYEAKLFAMGHQLDPRNYEKCWTDEAWMWHELSKIFDKNNP